ncbi:MAG: hypothetical protein PHI96_10455, partial [Desulfovibrio sp.]|nr:hypothetical protein [Desulfovibrio sp.]
MRILYLLCTVVSVGCLFMLFPAGGICAQSDALASVTRSSAQAGYADAAPALTGETLQRVAQIYAPRGGIRVSPCAVRNDDMRSPKSVTFNAEGTRIYVNALEGFSTLVYSFPKLEFIAKISHTFTEADHDLFGGEQSIFDYVYHKKAPSGNPNIFSGKPVEAALSHEGKYLWVPYYRRDFDKDASCPSAVAIIDVASNSIVRVMPTGTLPKVVAVSPDDNLVAI